MSQITKSSTIVLDGIWARRGRFDRLCQLLKSRCGPAEVFNYNTSGLIPFETLGAQLCDKLRAFHEPVNLIGFSMGGIVIRTAHLLEPTLPIRRAVFLNTPHAGTLMSYLLPLSGTRHLQPTSPLMRRLAADDWRIPTLVTWSPFDPILVPGRSARWPRASQFIRCVPLLHNWPIWSSRIHRQITTFLAKPVVVPQSERIPQLAPTLSTQNSALRT